MAESEAYRRGAELRRTLLGDEFVERANKKNYADPMMRQFIDVATEAVFGTLWTRPGLDLKTRTLRGAAAFARLLRRAGRARRHAGRLEGVRGGTGREEVAETARGRDRSRPLGSRNRRATSLPACWFRRSAWRCCLPARGSGCDNAIRKNDACSVR